MLLSFPDAALESSRLLSDKDGKPQARHGKLGGKLPADRWWWD